MAIKNPPPALLSPRSMLILTVAVLLGVAAGTLTLMAGHSPAEAVLAGGGTMCASVVALHALIGP